MLKQRGDISCCSWEESPRRKAASRRNEQPETATLRRTLTHNDKMSCRGGRDGSVIKNTSCSCRGSGFGSQDLHGGSELSVSLVLEN